MNMKFKKLTQNISIALLFAAIIACNRNALVDSSDLSEIIIPDPGETAFISIPGRTLSGGIWNLWKVNQWIEEYFTGINNDFPPLYAIAYYFDNSKMYYILSLTSQEHYLVEADSYSYNEALGDFDLASKFNASFNTENGIMGYFDPDESFDYSLIYLQKQNSFSGTVKNTTFKEVEARMSVLHHQYASLGDGVSAGSIQVNVNYTGSHTVSESNPIFVELYNLPNVYSHDWQYGGIVTSKTGSAQISHLPDGSYFAIVYIRPSLITNPDDDIQPGDSHLWYGGAYYAETGFSGTAIPIAITGGSFQSIAIDFDDAHPFTRKKELYTTFNGVSANFAAGTITVNVDIDTSSFGSGNTANQQMHIQLFSPRSYLVKGISEGEYFWKRGQSMGLSLSYTGGMSWQGNFPISNFNESGNWMVYGIYVSDNVDGTWGNGNDVRASFEAQARGNIMPYYIYTENDNYHEGQGPCKNNIPICYVNISTSTPDITGPELISITTDKTSIMTGDMAKVTLVFSDTGSGLPGGGFAGRLWLTQAGAFESFEDGVMFDIKQSGPDYYADVIGTSLPSMGDWTIRAIQILDAASNKSNYYLFDDPFWSGNPCGIDDSHYYLYNHEGILPVQSSSTKITITKY